jgi:SAM-dependent methyltransferase
MPESAGKNNSLRGAISHLQGSTAARDARMMRLRQARASGQAIRLRIVSPSDAEKDSFAQFQWSDYWIKYELIKALGQLPDLYLTDYQPHVVLHLFGFPTQLDPRIYNMAWIYGHPDLVTDVELMQYDHIFCYSGLFQKELDRRGYASEMMIAATAKRPAPNREILYPATFVGNARKGGGGRPAVDALLETGEYFLVWGKGWETRLARKNLVGPYYDYSQLGELYASSEFVLNDHHPDMARWGFVSFRIFDALATGGFVISDRNPGIEEIFGNTVPQFANAAELKDLMAYYRAHPGKKEQLRDQGQRMAQSHTWEARAKQIQKHLMAVARPPQARRSKTAEQIITGVQGQPSAGAPPLRLHLGCGSVHLDGYVNLDKYPTKGADRVMSADRLYYADESVDEICSSHMIEHLNVEELDEALREWRRVLKPHGRVVVRCPNFEIYLREWLAGDDEYRLGWGRTNLFGHSNRGEGLWHRHGFSPGSLTLLFEKHGFSTVKCEVAATRPEYDHTIEYRPDGDIIYQGERTPEEANNQSEATVTDDLLQPAEI